MTEAALTHGLAGFVPVQEMITSRVKGAESPEDLDLLAEVVTEAPMENPAEMLARGMFIADLLGRLDALEEDNE